MTFGIFIIALGYDLYGNSAYNLALSLKAYDEKIKVCLLHDNKSIEHLTKPELDCFDKFIEIDPKDIQNSQYQRSKLCVYKYSPYDFTVYMDVDSIWLPGKTPSMFIGDVLSDQFRIGMYGGYNIEQNRILKEGYTFWGEPIMIAKYHNLQGIMPQTISGYFSFWKSPENEALFNMALEVYDDQDAPAKKWAGGKADEYCFNVAMCKLGRRQDEFHPVYFDKVNGKLTGEEIYKNYWSMAMGTHKVTDNLVVLYNALVNKYSQVKGMDTRHYHVDKRDVIPERNIF